MLYVVFFGTQKLEDGIIERMFEVQPGRNKEEDLEKVVIAMIMMQVT